MDILYAQFIGAAALLTIILSVQCKKKKNVMLVQTIANILYSFQYVLLGAYSAAILNVVTVSRCMVCYEYDKKRIPSEQKRFEDYLQGIPFHFHYANEDIETFLNSLGINKEGKKYEPSKMWNLYAYLIYSETLKNK